MSGDGLLGLGVRRPVGVGMVVAAAVVFGFIALGRLPVDLLPPIQYPTLTVRTVWDGAAPEDIEERVTDRLEEVLSTVGSLVSIRSSSRAEVSEILMQFAWGADLPSLVQEVRERVNTVFLPAAADEPLILRYDPALDPVMRLALSGGGDLVRLRDLAESDVERRLEGREGVAAVRVSGGLEDEIHVLVDPAVLARYGIGGDTIRQRLLAENLNVPGGTLLEGSTEYVVRTLNEFRTLDEIRELPILSPGGRTVRLRELASVERRFKDRDVVLRVGGEEAVEISVFREAGANITDVARDVRLALFGSAERDGKPPEADPDKPLARSGYIAGQLPSDVHLTLLSDQSAFIEDAIGEVKSAALWGGLFAILVCFFFLRRMAVTFVIGLAVPISIVATFGAMFASGVSMNIMSLGGLALGIGMLVDNAIVVLESITRCREEGDPPLAAAVRGVREVGGAVTASTLTTIAVFAPIVFVEGIAGQTFGDQALTVVASLLISLAVALFFIPGLAARVPLGTTGEVRREGLRPHARALFPQLRGRLFAGLPWSRRVWAYLLSLAGLAVAGWLLGRLVPGLDDAWIPPGTEKLDRGFDPVPPEVRRQMATLSWLGMVAALPGVVVIAQPLVILVSRLASDLIGASFFVLRALATGLLAVLYGLLWTLSWLVQVPYLLFERVYPRILRRTLRAPLLVFLLVGIAAWSAWAGMAGIGRELLPEVRQGELSARLYFTSGTPLTESDSLATHLERKIGALPEVGETAVVSGTDRETVSTEESGPHTAQITLRLKPAEDLHAAEARVERAVRDLLAGEPALARFELRRPTLMALNAPLEVEIIGPDLDELARIARLAEQALQQVDGLVDIRSSVRRGSPEVRITLDREQLARHGLNSADVAARLRLAVEGETASTFPGRDERIDIRVRADLSRMQHVDQLRDLPVNPDSARPLPLGAVADIRIEDGPGDVRHITGRRAAVLSASLAEFDLGRTADDVRAALADLPLPPGFTVSVGGQTREMDSALSSLAFALALAVFLVYAVMAAQFESLLQPFLILFAVPLAGIGAGWALAATGTPLSVVVLLGTVVLAGIVVNNAIVLVDRVNRNRARGLKLDEALVEAGSARLRPILMTTTSTVLGMLPMTGWIGALGGSEGAELREPMALVVIAGLISSTALTLLVIPTGYRVLAMLSPATRRDG